MQFTGSIEFVCEAYKLDKLQRVDEVYKVHCMKFRQFMKNSIKLMKFSESTKMSRLIVLEQFGHFTKCLRSLAGF